MKGNTLRDTLNKSERKLSEKPGTMQIATKDRKGKVTWSKKTFSREAAAMSYLSQLRRQGKLYDSQEYKEGV